jgi:hypothetical protein
MAGNAGLLHASKRVLDVDLPDASATPLVFNASIDTTNTANVVLIDSTLADKQIFYDSANANTFPIIYDYNSKTDDLLALFRQKFPASSIQRISLVFHDRGTNFMAGFMNNKSLFQESDLALNQTSFSDNVSFLISCMKEFRVSHIDFLACNTLQYSNWKSYYALLAAQTSVVVGASNDKTGNLNYGGDWVMESTHENVRDLYFNASISNYASTLVLSTITLNGANGDVGLRMNTGVIEYYNTTSSTWTAIGSGNWPVRFVNSNLSSVLKVVFTQDLTINATYGNTAGYFIAGSSYITFDGSNNFINITNITNYLGLIQNGSTATTTTGTNGYANVIVQNIKTNVTGTSTLSITAFARAGWICAASFGRGAAANQIINCTNNGAVPDFCGGICGERVAIAGGNVTITNCQNTGNISGTGGGGIVGLRAGESGTLYISGCPNSGTISGNGAGGIAGQQTGQTNTGPGSATFVNCTNTGLISGVNAGGIAGLYAGAFSGSATFTNCTNSGTISVQNAGGIAGAAAGDVSGSASFTNCTNSGQISGVDTGGIAGSGAGSATFVNCTNTGLISGQNAGGIAGDYVGYGGSSATFTNCMNSGTISGSAAGGIAGLYAGEFGSASFTNCTNTGIIIGVNAGGIAGLNAGFNEGLAEFTNCANTGAIDGFSSGGIVGGSAGNNYGLVTITNCFSTGTINGEYAGGIAGDWFGYNTSENCVISECYSTGAISGNNAGGIVGAEVGFTDDPLITPNVNITNSYSLGTIATTTGGICGGTEGDTYAVDPTITITNCYSSGTIVDANSGIVAIGLLIPISKPNTYVAAGTWTDASANASGALTGTPTGVGLANKGVTWTSYDSANTPYLLSSYWSLTGASQLYTPNSVSSSTNYTSSGGLYTSGTYSIASSSQVSNTITLNVIRIASTSPYYGYYGGTFAFTNTGSNSGSITSSINASNGVLNFILPYPCFLEGSKILCFENNREVYRPIESLRKGDLVKTIYNGYMPIHMIGTTALYNPGNDYRFANRLYKCSREKYPALFEDLYITGCHSILVPSMTDDQWENTKAVNGDIFVTDNHFRLIACADEKAEPFNKEGFVNIYHVALENNDYYMNYGIYANGLLVESCSKRYLTEISNMRILGEADCSASENVVKVPFNMDRQLVETY